MFLSPGGWLWVCAYEGSGLGCGDWGWAAGRGGCGPQRDSGALCSGETGELLGEEVSSVWATYFSPAGQDGKSQQDTGDLDKT